ncbi:ATP12 family chaperone protein [Blastochloris viridis]|uniref:ATP12 chaperone protein n=1 Tax=Blastochloris viridis TaxID=1079 RepID=A0A0H5BFH0_BLAVI|nr:ATP12 family protein [Blastochloris viridis]ALK09191.1 ATP12 chaperone protein [Blastochloris viridis]BAS00943.1 chaperone required for the assembly of the mitochondrial F1-ATPase [Blastochloris viridis]CUU41854.1 ATP12 chaperone protein [Blastochloris viridis]
MSIRDLLADLETPGPEHDPMRAAQRAMRPQLPKRFYADVAVAEDEGGWTVTLDGRRPKTPRGRALTVPTRTLAEALAAEWVAQAEVIDPATMPLTRLINVTIDEVTGNGRVQATIDEIVKYAGSDLVCYRAGEPAGLVTRQAEAWDPVLAFARERLGARFMLAEGVTFVDQTAAAIDAVRRAVEATPPFALGGLYTLTALAGSVLIPLAVAGEGLTSEAGWDAAHVDEDWQMAFWGGDDEAAARRAFRKAEWDAAVRVIRDVC